MDKYIEEVKEIVELATDLVEGGAVINKYDLKESLNGKLKDLIQSAKKEAVEECLKKIDHYTDELIKSGAEEQSDYYMGELNAVSRIIELLK